MALLRRTLAVFRVRSYPNYEVVRFPAYFIMLGMMVISFAAYLFGSTKIEFELRHTFLIAFGFALLVWLAHLVHPSLSRWMAVFSAVGLFVALAALWRAPGLLHLLVIPIILAAVLVNIPATFLTVLLESMLVGNLGRFLPAIALSGDERATLYLTLWITALIVGSGFWLVERLLMQASDDYHNMQVLLENARTHQVQLAEALDDLEHANRQLSLLYDKNISLRKISEEATQAKTNYIARVSHEIRTPLNMILGITESIIDNEEVYIEEIPLDLLDDIRIIRRNSEHLLSLVNDVLDLTRAEASQLVLHKQWSSLGDEIESSVEIVLPLARKKQIALHAEVPEATPEVFCDRTRIRQVILNLVSNAVRYTEHGQVQVSVQADEKWVTVCVRDTGTGIDPQDAERIFEPFYRGQAGAHQESAGSGLGLSVSRQFVELHGGKIWLESAPGQGSSFFFRLPLAADEPLPRTPTSLVSQQWVWVERRRDRERRVNFSQPQKKKVILYSEDEEILTYFQKAGAQAEVVPARSLAVLCEEYNRAPAHRIVVNAATLGELLPLMAQVSAQIKDTPVIGSLFLSLREQIRKTGAAGYLQKPFSNQQLRQVVARLAPNLRRLLIVDDNTDIQKLIVRALSEQFEAVEFLLAPDGAEALRQLERRPVDLVLLDIALPDRDGWQVLEDIQADPGNASLPVVIISAHDISDTPYRSKALVMMEGDGILFSEFLQQTMGDQSGI